MVLVAGFSSGFPMLRTTSICQGTNPCEQVTNLQMHFSKLLNVFVQIEEKISQRVQAI